MKKLEIKYLPVSALTHLDGNPRKVIDPDAVEKLQKLIKEHGFQNPLQVFAESPKKYSILCGNHRFDAGVKLGMKEFPCIVYAGNRAKALARAVSDNKSGEWTNWDFPKLKDLIVEIDNGDFNVSELTGFDQEEIDNLFNPHIPEEEWEGMPEYSHEDLSPKKSLIVHFSNDKDYSKFQELIEQKLTPKTKSIWFPKAEIETYIDKVYTTGNNESNES